MSLISFSSQFVFYAASKIMLKGVTKGIPNFGIK